MNTAPEQTIVITGMSCLLPGSSTPKQLWKRLLDGQSALAPYHDARIDSKLMGWFGHLSAEQQTAAAEALPFKLRRFASSCSMWGVKAAADALADAKIDLKSIPDDRCGLFTAQGDYLHPSAPSFATGLGKAASQNLPMLSEEFIHHRGVEPFMAIKSLANNLLATASLTLGMRGDCGAFVQDRSATIAALRSAAFSVQHGYSDVALLICSGSYNEVLTLVEMQLGGYLSAGSEGPQSLRPFDCRRDGTMVGEGAIALVLETEARAAQRGATIYAVVGGIGNCVQMPGSVADHQAYRRSVGKALLSSGIGFDDVGALVVRGSGGRALDVHEAHLLTDLQEGRDQLPVTCPTPIVGSIPGCPVDWLVSIGILRHGLIPPIAHLEQPIQSNLNFVQSQPLSCDAQHVLSLSADEMGFHSAILFSAPLR